MKIRKQIKYPEWAPMMYLKIGDKVIYNGDILQCVIGSGACSKKGDKPQNCAFHKPSNLDCAQIHLCTPYRRECQTVVAFIKVDS